MRDINRIDNICNRIATVWKKYPDLRLGQLIGNVCYGSYYVEDEVLIEAIEKYYSYNYPIELRNEERLHCKTYEDDLTPDD